MSQSRRGFSSDGTAANTCDKEQAHYAAEHLRKIPFVAAPDRGTTLTYFERTGRLLGIALVQGITVPRAAGAGLNFSVGTDPEVIIALGFVTTDDETNRRELRAIIGFDFPNLGLPATDPPHKWALPARNGQSGGPIVNPFDSMVVGIISGSNTATTPNILERSVLMRWTREADNWVRKERPMPRMEMRTDMTTPHTLLITNVYEAM